MKDDNTFFYFILVCRVDALFSFLFCSLHFYIYAFVILHFAPSRFPSPKRKWGRICCFVIKIERLRPFCSSRRKPAVFPILCYFIIISSNSINCVPFRCFNLCFKTKRYKSKYTNVWNDVYPLLKCNFVYHQNIL